MRATAIGDSGSSTSFHSSTTTCKLNLPPVCLPGKDLSAAGNKQLCIGRRKRSLGIAWRTWWRFTYTTSCALSSWNDRPYFDFEQELTLHQRKHHHHHHHRFVFLEEQDVVTFLDPPKQLIPLDSSSYNPAHYLWKKIADIPEERRHRLLSLLKPSLISRAWEIAGTKYEDPRIARKSASSLLSGGDDAKLIEFWNCRTSAGSAPISWINFFKKAVFRCKDGGTYGRFIGGSVLAGVSNSFPLYFMVKQVNEVMSTEQPCDLAYEFGDGRWDFHDCPLGFPKPAKHPWPFNDEVVVYIRHIGPGVMVGQAWQEGAALQQVPKKLCGEILMLKDLLLLE